MTAKSKDTSHGTAVRYGKNEDLGDAIIKYRLPFFESDTKEKRDARAKVNWGDTKMPFECGSFDPESARLRGAAACE